MLAFKLLPFVALATSVWGSPIDNVNGTSLEARAGRTYTGDGTLFFSPYILRHTGTNIDNHSDILQSGSRCLRTDQRSQRFHRLLRLTSFLIASRKCILRVRRTLFLTKQKSTFVRGATANPNNNPICGKSLTAKGLLVLIFFECLNRLY